MHLSVGRAMAVRTELVNDKVQGSRIKVGGWGEHRPLKMNPTSGGEAANRRVELYLVPRNTSALTQATTTTDTSSQADATDSNAFPPK